MFFLHPAGCFFVAKIDLNKIFFAAVVINYAYSVFLYFCARMRLVRNILFFVLSQSLGAFSFLGAQDFLALSGSDYEGLYGVYDNPSRMTSNRLYVDINLMGNSFSFNSNYAFLKGSDYRINTFFAPEYEIPVYYDSENEKRYFDIYRNDKLKFGNIYNHLLGPGVMFAYERHAFALTTAYKQSLHFENMPQDIANFLYEAIDFDYQHNSLFMHHKPQKMHFGYLSWMEAGLSYAYTFYREGWDFLAAGITLKPLFANFGGYMRIDDLEYIVYNDTVANIPDASFEYGYGGSLSPDATLKSLGFTSPFFNNFGFGGDIGITYQRTAHIHRSPFHGRVCEWEYEPYNYRVSVSLSDMGYINFYRNSFAHKYMNTYAHWEEETDTLKANSLHTLDVKLQKYFDPENIQEHRRTFRMFLPSSLNIEADYPLDARNFLHAKIVVPFNMGENYLMRSSVISFNYRYEIRQFSVGVPLTIYDYNWKQPKIGVALRIGNVMVGSDRFSNLLGLNDITGMDFYFAYRISLSRVFRSLYVKGLCDPYRDYNIETFDYRQYRNR